MYMSAWLAQYKYEVQTIALGLLLLATFVFRPVLGSVFRQKTGTGFFHHNESRLFLLLLLVVLLFGLASYAVQIVAYLIIPGYIDHIQSSVAAISIMAARGLPVYPALEPGQNVYGLLYGPLLYEISVPLHAVSTGGLATKLPGVLAALGAIAIEFFCLRRALSDRRLALMLWGALVLIIAAYGYATFWNRADSLLIFCAACAHGAYLFGGRHGALPLVALIGGLAAGFKLHGFLYVAPFGFSLLLAKDYLPRRIGNLAVAAVLFLLGLVLPLLPANVSIATYLEYLELASRHGLSLELLILNQIWVLAMLVLAPLMLMIGGNRRISRDGFVLMLAAIICAIVVGIVAAKPGAGIYHMLPFIPVAVAVYACVLSGTPLVETRKNALRTGAAGEKGRGALALLIILLLVAFGPSVGVRLLGQFQRLGTGNEIRAQESEARAFFEKYPGGQMGASGSGGYALTRWRVLGVQQGGELALDYPAWMDLQFSGVSDGLVEALVENCRVPAWLLPAGEAPFSQLNFYRQAHGKDAETPLFSRRFVELFNANYREVARGKYFNTYVCAGNQP